MITVTDLSARAVHRMTNTDTYPQAGLSIKKADDDTFGISVVPEPGEDDVAVPGINVYLDPPAANALDDATLDADEDAHFVKDFVLR